MDEARRARELLGRVAPALGEIKKGALLEQIAWPREVEERFFAGGAGSLPEVGGTAIDRTGGGHDAHVSELAELCRGHRPATIRWPPGCGA